MRLPWRRRRTAEERTADAGRGPRIGRRFGAMLALIVAIGVVVVIVLAGESSPSSGSSNNTNAASGATAVQRRNLVETDTESGTLSYANSYTVYNRLSGTITWLPAVGQLIKPGQTLYKVGGDPVTLMNGNTPAYRDLNSSDSAGPDILELNKNLIRLGFDAYGIVADDEWQAATTDGVELFQESLGETETGDLTLGQIVFLPGNQLISNVETTLGSDGAGGGSATAYDPPAGGASSEFVSLTKSAGSSTTPSSNSPGQTNGSSPGTSSKPCTPKSKSGSKSNSKSSKKASKKPCKANTVAALTALLNAATAELRAETAQLNANHGGGGSPGNSGSGSPSGSGNSGNSGNSGSSGSSGNSGSGSSGGGSATAIIQTSSTQLVATVDLDATKQSEARVGEHVQVELPNGNTVDGKITAVSSVAQSSSNGNGNGNGNGGGGGGGGNSNSSSGAVIPVTIALSGHQVGAGLDQAAVSVNFSEAQANNVLSVPVTALLATSGGNYEVQEAAAPHTLIPVTTGLFAAGYVAISGPGIYPGLEVTDSQG